MQAHKVTLQFAPLQLCIGKLRVNPCETRGVMQLVDVVRNCVSVRRRWKTEAYTVRKEFVDLAVRIAKEYGVAPESDVFASVNRRFTAYWNRKDDAFAQCWSGRGLWINPPFSRMEAVVAKVR